MKNSTSKIFASSICAVLATTGISNASVISIDLAGVMTTQANNFTITGNFLRANSLIIGGDGVDNGVVTAPASSGNVLGQTPNTTTIDVNDFGTFIANRNVFLGNGGSGTHTFTVTTGGLADFNDTVGVGRDEATGVLDIQGGVVEIAGNLDFFNGGGGNIAGDDSAINFGTADTGSLTVTGSILDQGGATVSFENLFDTGFLTADGQVDGDSFADIFEFDADTNTLSLVAVPEPSSTALLGLGALALILRRKK